MQAETDLKSLFTRTLSRFFFQQRRAYGKVAAAAHLDVKYLYELVKGKKQNPSRDVVIRIGTALKLGLDDMDELLLAANHAPLVRPRRRRASELADALLMEEDSF
jgi:hypothetical protein